MENWKSVTIGEIAKLNTTSYSEKEKWEYVNYLDTGSIVENKIYSIQYFDTQKDNVPSRAKRKVRKNSIIYSTVRPNQRHYGIIKTIPENFLVSTGFTVIDVDETVADADFVYYSLACDNVTDRLMTIANNSTSSYPSITPDDIAKTEIKLPNIATQKKIAGLLGLLDRKIAENDKINDNLEQQAQMLYEYWFVQFDFPDKDGKPYKKSGNQMAYNHILKMDIPLGWTVGTLSDIANITMGQSPEGESYNEDGNGIEFFQGSTDFGIFFPTTRVYTTNPKRMSKENDILLSVRAPVGTMNIAYQDCCIGRGLASIQGKTNNTSFVRHLLKSNKKFFDRINNAGTTFGAITKDILYEMPVIIPPAKVMMEYESLVSKSDSTIRSSENEIRHLTHIRDYLLPLLLNGQLSMDI